MQTSVTEKFFKYGPVWLVESTKISQVCDICNELKQWELTHLPGRFEIIKKVWQNFGKYLTSSTVEKTIFSSSAGCSQQHFMNLNARVTEMSACFTFFQTHYQSTQLCFLIQWFMVSPPITGFTSVMIRAYSSFPNITWMGSLSSVLQSSIATLRR